jgi:hypothetical protein
MVPDNVQLLRAFAPCMQLTVRETLSISDNKAKLLLMCLLDCLFAGLISSLCVTLPERVKMGASGCPASRTAVFLFAALATLIKRHDAAKAARDNAVLVAATASAEEALQAAPDPGMAVVQIMTAAGRMAHKEGLYDVAAEAAAARGRDARAAAAAAAAGSGSLTGQLSRSSSSSSSSSGSGSDAGTGAVMTDALAAASDAAIADHIYARMDQQAAAAHAIGIRQFGCVTVEQLQQLLLVCVEVCRNVSRRFT